MSYQEEDNSGKILLAVLAGAGAGIIAGLLMAPDKGKATREKIGSAATKYSGQFGEQLSKYTEDLDSKFKGYVEKLEDMGIGGIGSSLKMKGNWDDAKGKLKQQYAQLTDDDLDSKFKGYVEKLEDMGIGGIGSSLKMKGNWDDAKGKLKQQYAQLTDDDLEYADGKGDELVGRLQQKLGKAKGEIVKMLNDL